MHAATRNAEYALAKRQPPYRPGLAIAAAMLAFSSGWPIDSAALECPAMPQQAQRDWDVAVAVAVGRLGEASGPTLQARTRTVTTDLLARLPRADRVYLEQMMYATYCSSLRDNAALSEVERNSRIGAYNRELRATLNAGARPVATADPRDAARADLARLPVEYTPGAFLESARDGKTAVVRLFLQAGIDPNIENDRGYTALIYAAARGNLAMIEILLKARADVNAIDGAALGFAARNGRLDAMRLLIKAGAAKASFDRALQMAVSGGEIDALRLMVEQGANLRADDGKTTNSLAGVEAGPARLADLLNFLLQRGWPVDARNERGETALMLAASQNNTALIESLLRAGANIKLRCGEGDGGCAHGGYAALEMASAGGHEQAVRLLVNAGADVNESSSNGTALVLASAEGAVDVVKLLLSKGADPNARNGDGDTSLMQASRRNGNDEVVSLLLAAGAEVNAAGKTGQTALMWASRGGPAVARKLLDAGARVEQTTQTGATALMFAAANGSILTARLLLQRGARVDIVDADHQSALAIASESLIGDDRARMLALLGGKEPQ